MSSPNKVVFPFDSSSDRKYAVLHNLNSSSKAKITYCLRTDEQPILPFRCLVVY